MNNSEVAHLWANQSRTSAKGSSFYFEGDTIYSYGSHFPIARHYKGAVLFTTKGYSNTTARHISLAARACSHLVRFNVLSPASNPSGEDVTRYGSDIADLALRAARARNPERALSDLQDKVNEANQFCERFGFKSRFTMPDNLPELKAKALASAARERKQEAAKQARIEAENLEKVQQWLAGAAVSVPYQISKTYLRAVAGDMETSRGAIVPLVDAERAFRFAMLKRETGWHRNGETFKVGDYQLDAINEAGIVAGCHRLGWEEIERFALSQGWTDGKVVAA